MFGEMVVKGYEAISTSTSVQALKKVDFPELGFPAIAIVIISFDFL
jgi:hypothetical protein